MEKKKLKQNSLLLKVVRSMGKKSIDSKCSWWFNQPKVTKEIKERIK